MTDKPKTVYELCESVCEAIELAPKNYYQQNWHMRAQDVYGKEACGTAYCRAGWMYALGKGGKNSANSIVLYARRVIGGAGIEDYGSLFYAGANFPHAPGTDAYVKAGVQGMRDFMAKHEAKLKAAKLGEDGEVIRESGTASE